MYPPAHHLLAQSRIDDLHRSALARARRTEARRALAEARATRRARPADHFPSSALRRLAMRVAF